MKCPELLYELGVVTHTYYIKPNRNFSLGHLGTMYVSNHFDIEDRLW